MAWKSKNKFTKYETHLQHMKPSHIYKNHSLGQNTWTRSIQKWKVYSDGFPDHKQALYCAYILCISVSQIQAFEMTLVTLTWFCCVNFRYFFFGWDWLRLAFSKMSLKCTQRRQTEDSLQWHTECSIRACIVWKESWPNVILYKAHRWFTGGYRIEF